MEQEAQKIAQLENQVQQLMQAVQQSTQLQQQQQQLLQQQQQQQQQLLQQLQQLQPPPHPQPRAQLAPAGDAHIDSESSDQDEPSVAAKSWDLVLKSQKMAVTSAHGKSLVSMLSDPPPLEKLKAAEHDAVHFLGVPETPGPRRNKIDFNLWQSQHKLEEAMHSLLNHFEQGDQKHLGLTAAWLRSAWQDLHEQRRVLLAGGRGKNLLEKRPDDVRARLLTPQEEEKISKARKPPAKAKNLWGSNPGPNPPRPPQPPDGFRGRSHSRSRSQTRGSGNGKGKGGGKSL